MSFGSIIINKGSVFRGLKRATGELTGAPEEITRLCLQDSDLFAEWVVDNIAIVKRVVDEVLSQKEYKVFFDRPDSPVTRDDLISAGVLGLYEARKKFDPSRGVKFITYAYNWIRCYIHREIAKAFKGPPRSGEEGCLLSLDRPVFDDNHVTYAETIASERKDPEKEVSDKILEEAVRELMDSCLNEEEKKIIEKLWFEGKTPGTVAKEEGIPQKEVIRLRRSAIDKMRKALYNKKGRVLSEKTRQLLLSYKP